MVKIKLTFYKQASLITFISVAIFFLRNLIEYSINGLSLFTWLAIENTWTLPIFGIILLIIMPFEKRWTRYFQAILFFIYGFFMISGKGINYDCMALFFVGSLLLRKYGFFLKDSFIKLIFLVIFIAILCYSGHLASGLPGSVGWDGVHSCVALILVTTLISCALFWDDIRVYQNEKKKREDERLRQAGKILTDINATLYRLLSLEKDKSENIGQALDILKLIGVYAEPGSDEKMIEVNLIDYVDFALIFSGATTIIKNYEDIPPVKIYRHDFLISLVILALRAAKSMENMDSKLMEVSIKKDGDSTKITIKDSGVGMNKSEVRCLWEDENMKQVATCIKRHGWEIMAESLPTLYTEFAILIKLKRC